MIIIRMLASNVQFLSGSRWCAIKLTRAWLTMSKPIVTVKQGKLQGAVLKSVLGPSYIAFKGIPFAAPPIGDLRFKDPQPPESWSGVKDTSEIVGYSCTQLEQTPPNNVFGDEDCLYLNVYTNSLDQSKPVMFWIHGGAFVVGSSSFEFTRPDYLLAKDVVVVTVNYRLGAFGFLNLGHRVAPGNQGLKDLIMALEWVKENIANFGGDTNNVTIFGVSAGGILTHSLLISPRAKGLFHKAIMQSGTLYCPWGRNQSRPERSFKLASLLGFNSTDPVKVVEFLRTVSAKDIALSQPFILSPKELACWDLAFGVGNDEMAEDPVLPQPIEQLLSNGGNIPVIVGFTSMEYIMFINDKSKKTIETHNYFLPQYVKNLTSLKNLGDAETEKVLNYVKKQYFGGKPISEESVESLIKFVTDIYFGIPTMLFVEDRVKSKTENCFVYEYAYVGNEKTPTDLLVKRIIPGSSHSDEIAYLFYLPLCKTENPEPPADGTKDRITLERLTRMWTVFARTGNPADVEDEFVDSEWWPGRSYGICYLKIGDILEIKVAQQHALSPNVRE